MVLPLPRRIAVAALTLALAACAPPSVGSIDAITIHGGDRELAPGASVDLTVDVETTGDVDDGVTWASSVPDVATVDADGVVTAHGSGTTEITATSTADPSRFDTITLTVTAPSSVVGVVIDQGDVSVAVGESLALTVTVDTTGDVDDGVTWSSSDPDVATVDASGVVTVHSTGSTGVTATSVADPSQSDTITLRVVPPPGTALWTRQFGTAELDVASGLAIDADSNVYVVGHTRGALDGAISGPVDAFIRSYDQHGNPRWTRQFGTSGRDVATGVASAANGDLHVVGTTSGDFHGTRTGHVEAFVRVFDTSGHHRWTRQFGPSTGASDVAIDPSGNVYVVGGTGGALEGSAVGDDDAFVRSYDASGHHRWTRQYGTSDLETASGVATDADGNVYVTGHTVPTVEGGVVGDSDAFLLAYDGDGNLRWRHHFGTDEHDVGESVAADERGHVYVAGRTFGSLGGPNAGEEDAFVRSYDTHGQHRWTRQFGTAEKEVALGVATGAGGVVYVVGSTIGQFHGTDLSDHDAYIRAYDTDGVLLWTRAFGTPGHDLARAVAAGEGDIVYVAGQVHGDLEGPGTGSTDAFVRAYQR
jgi:hypothetical protein